MLFNRAVYSLTREMYVAGCELHIQTPTLLIVLTLKTICQRQNHLSGLFYDRVCTLSPVCSLQSELCGLRFTLTDIVSEKLTI